MLTIIIPEKEQFNDKTQEFVQFKEQKLSLEHSLISISKWESKWHKSFISTKTKTDEEILDYIKCMTITSNVDDNIYNNLTVENIIEIKEYINNTMTATVFYDYGNQQHSNEIITSELIYYWMITQNIPMECEKWHLNRLLVLIRLSVIKNSKGNKKMTKREIMENNSRLNEQRRKMLNSKG